MSLCLKFLRAVVIVCAGALLLTSPSVRADTGLEPAADVKAVRAMIKLTDALDAAGVNTAKFLEDHGGFPPDQAGIDQHTWLSMPDLVKVHLMYKYAAAKSQPSAEWVLFTLIKAAKDGGHLPPDYPDYSAPPRDPPPGFDPNRPGSFRLESLYKLPEAHSERSDITAEERASVRALAARRKLWVKGGALNGLRSEFNLKVGEAAELLFTARTPEMAFEHALPKNAEERTKLIAAVQEKLEGGGRREQVARGTPAPQPKLDSPLDKIKLIKDWEDKTGKELPTEAERKYESIRKRAGFPGGILFGAPVTADQKLGKPKAMKYVAGKNEADGVIEVSLPADSVLTLPGVSAEDAAVATEMIFGEKAVKAGDGISIIDISGTVPYYQFGEKRLATGKRCQVLLNPALLDTGLGWAAVYIDSLPESRAWLLNQVKDDPVLKEIPDKDERKETERYRRQVIDWVFDPWRNARREGSTEARRITLYRILDVPMRVAAKEKSLVVTRNTDDLEITDSLLEMQVLIQPVDLSGKPKGKPTSLDKYTAESARLMPALMTFSPEFRRLSDFARLLAVFRWARDAGVKQLDNAPARPKGPQTPAAVATTANEITPIKPFDADEVVKEDIKNAEKRRAILRKDPGVLSYEAAREKFTEELIKAAVMEQASVALKMAESSARDADRLFAGSAVTYLRALVDLEFDLKMDAILERRLKKDDPDYDVAIEEVKKLADELIRSSLSDLEQRRLAYIGTQALTRLEVLKKVKSVDDPKK